MHIKSYVAYGRACRACEWMHGWMDGWVDGWVGGWMGGWVA